ncbi:hypothetical protein ACFL20_12020 [Spirochaetota bacterium]
MRLINRLLIATFLMPLCCLSLYSKTASDYIRSSNVGGATGLITAPTAFTGWAESNFGMEFGYHYINESEDSHIPKISVHLFKMFEMGFTYDVQEKQDDESDLLLHSKFRILSMKNSAIAVGGNYQMISRGTSKKYHNGQLYFAATHSSSFFNMPAETTIVIGKTFGEETDKNELDFSMGFDLNIIPKLFKGHAHWINDISNFSYSNDPKGDNYWRGIFNTGIRFAILNRQNIKLNVDFIISDAFDNSRSFNAGAALGFAL